MRVEAWRVHDTGLVAAPGPFRRLPGRLRHHRGRGLPWPDRVVLELVDQVLVVSDTRGEELARWSRDDVSLRATGAGPPVTFVVEVPDGAHLLAAPAGAATDALVSALAPPTGQ